MTAQNFNDLNVIVPNFFSSLLGHQESAKKAERIRAVCQQRKAQVKAGERVQLFKVPFWLEWKDGKYVLIPEKARAVERMFKLAAAGHSVVEIVGRLKGQWSSKTIGRTLVNKAVVGSCTQVDPPVADYFPAAVPEDLFYRAQSKISLMKQARRHTGNETNLFTGLAKCAVCGCPLVAHSSQHGARARLICSGRVKGRSKCDTRGAPLELVEKSFLSLMANADLLRPLLSGEEPKPSRLDELSARLADAEKQSGKLGKLILDDPDPSPTIYTRLKQEEQRAKELRAELEAEQGRERAQKPALVAYNEFAITLPELAKDPVRRPNLRRAVQALVEGITLNPRGQNGRWTYELALKGACAEVTVIFNSKPEGWLFRSLRPVDVPPTCAMIVARGSIPGHWRVPDRPGSVSGPDFLSS